MRKIWAIFNTNGAIMQYSDAEYDDNGNVKIIEFHEGPFEVPDDFGFGDFESQYYRLKKGQLVLNDDAKHEFDMEHAYWARENRRLEHRKKAAERLQAIQAEGVAKSATVSDDIIALSPLLTGWMPKAYAVGDIVQYEDAPYRCVQPHDATGNPGWNPIDASSLWANYHATSAEYALEWAQPTGAHDVYQKDEYMQYADIVYRCKTNNTVHAPDVLPGAWERI